MGVRAAIAIPSKNSVKENREAQQNNDKEQRE